MRIGLGLWLGAHSGGGGSATLLSVAQSLGATLLLDTYTPEAYALSGSTGTSITNRITGTSIAATGTPQYAATVLNGGPAFVFNGTTDCFTGTEADVYNKFSNNTAFTLICIAGWDVEDAAGAYFSVGDSGGVTPACQFRQITTGAGRHQANRTTDGSADTVTVTESNDGLLAAPSVIEWEFDGADVTLQLNREATSITGAEFDSANPLTPTKWTWGCLGRNTDSIFHDGPSSLVLVCPLLSAGNKNALYAALAAHHEAIAGLLA